MAFFLSVSQGWYLEQQRASTPLLVLTALPLQVTIGYGIGSWSFFWEAVIHQQHVFMVSQLLVDTIEAEVHPLAIHRMISLKFYFREVLYIWYPLKKFKGKPWQENT